MPKKKKTREQKISADKRRRIEIPASKSAPSISTHSYTKPEALSPAQTINRATTITTSGYSYLVSDLTKTVLLTIGIIIVEYILFIVIF